MMHEYVFITGMGRSGTTLVDKLLSSHQQIHIYSQPFPLLFVEAKKQFLRSIGEDSYYVLNDDIVSRHYSQEAFERFLEMFALSSLQQEELFKQMDAYSGQYTKRIGESRRRAAGELKGFEKIYLDSFEYFSGSTKRIIGSKETMCEEFIPGFLKHGMKAIVIVRDPRDVVASANYPKGEKYFGEKKPLLFILRTWRKSVEFVKMLSGHPNFLYVKYEDLVRFSERELRRMTDFLGVAPFPSGHFSSGIVDQSGEPWKPNTSFEIDGAVISDKSVGIYRGVLSKTEIDYIETVCRYEMDWMEYAASEVSDKTRVIEIFRDHGVSNHPFLASDFSETAENVGLELSRLEQFEQFYQG